MQPQPVNPVALANCTGSVSPIQLEVYKRVIPVYQEQIKKHPEIRWLKAHYLYLVGVVERRGLVGGFE